MYQMKVKKPEALEVKTMLIFSQAKLTIGGAGLVRVEGKLEPYRSRISGFVGEHGIRDITVWLRDGRFVFPKSVPPHTRKKLKNFLSAECPVQ
jgi:hypothetical protein